MADRKQFLGNALVDPELEELLEKAKKTEITEEQLHEQRISFAFGNALDSDLITKETVRVASQNIRLHN